MSGQLYAPVGPSSENPKAARALLVDLGKKDPGNAVYPFFRLTIEEKLGFTREQLKETAQEIANASVFDTHFSELDHEMRDARWLNPALHYALSYVYSSGMFAYYGPSSLLQRLAREGDFDGERRVAKLMTEDGLHSSRPSSSGDFDGSQYSTGRSLDPTSYEELSSLEKKRGRDINHYAPYPLIEKEGQLICDPGPYEAFVSEMSGAR